MARAQNWAEVNPAIKREVLGIAFRGIKLIGRVLSDEIDEAQFIDLADQLIQDSIQVASKPDL